MKVRAELGVRHLLFVVVTAAFVLGIVQIVGQVDRDKGVDPERGFHVLQQITHGIGNPDGTGPDGDWDYDHSVDTQRYDPGTHGLAPGADGKVDHANLADGVVSLQGGGVFTIVECRCQEGDAYCAAVNEGPPFCPVGYTELLSSGQGYILTDSANTFSGSLAMCAISNMNLYSGENTYMNVVTCAPECRQPVGECPSDLKRSFWAKLLRCQICVPE